jgi:hypothetical protein
MPFLLCGNSELRTESSGALSRRKQIHPLYPDLMLLGKKNCKKT